MKNDTIINLIKWLIERGTSILLIGEFDKECVSIFPLLYQREGIDCNVTFFSERFPVSLDQRKSFESAANIVIKVCGAENAYQQLTNLKMGAGKAPLVQ